MIPVEQLGWERLTHEGLLLDPARLRRVAELAPDPLPAYYEHELRRRAAAITAGDDDLPEFVRFVLETICGFSTAEGTWQRGPQVGTEWSRKDVAGEVVRPRFLWRGHYGGLLPVFFDSDPRLAFGRARKRSSQVVQWLRAGPEKLALRTNGLQWRLIFAGLDFSAWCEWDVDLWFEEGSLSPQVTALRTLLSPKLWVLAAKDAASPLLQAIQDSRKGQAELSAVLGERVREAVEVLIQAHGDVLTERCAGVDPADLYRAAVRVVMRMVVVLFGESRELLPKSTALYHGSYGLTGLLESLEKSAARGGRRLARQWNAWPRILSLFRLVHQGSHHPDLSVPEYGGDLFQPCDSPASDSPNSATNGEAGMKRALAVFETACFDRDLLSDAEVHHMLEHLTRTKVKVRQGRSSTWVPMPVDFSDLSSEYIGILYEGLLDFELKTAPPGDPVVFLSVGQQPALPLSRLEAMDERAIRNLLEKMKDTRSTNDSEEGDAGEDEESGDEESPEDSAELADSQSQDAESDAEDSDAAAAEGVGEGESASSDDPRHVTRTRAEAWAHRTVLAAGLVPRMRGRATPERQRVHEETIRRKARSLVTRVVLPGERYLVRWGGTRKGAGTFYTRPALAVPTVQRTLRPLAYTPPKGPDGNPDPLAPASAWVPRLPEQILALKVCDPACGSGTFPVAALRFLTEALFKSLHHHGRIREDGDRALVHLFGDPTRPETLSEEMLPAHPSDPSFEPRLRAVLLRHVVERCIYGVDFDPLAVELCKLALWIETMDRNLQFTFLRHKIKCGNALVGAWFDQFEHYPVMAWKREGGDKNHSNGVHFEGDVRGKAIKKFLKDFVTPDLVQSLRGQSYLFAPPATKTREVHTQALAVLDRMHALPVHEIKERVELHEDMIHSRDYKALKSALDRWCACWYWPADSLEQAPLSNTLASPLSETAAITASLKERLRFFHWELEFPDVFRGRKEPGRAESRSPLQAGPSASSSNAVSDRPPAMIYSGFDAVLGNPPWDIAKPNSKEFFSNLDPLYRTYGKQEALGHQSRYFEDRAIEHGWLDYNADFRSQSNYMKYAASPFGDPKGTEEGGDTFAILRGRENESIHAKWKATRLRSQGFSDPEHSFQHQGSADLNLYKLFLEQAHALLRADGRLGFIVPSGLYSDHGTGGLRKLFLDRCRWEWLFGFENREGIFEIDSRFKFNPVILEKGGKTDSIRTAFMRRKLEDWERAEEFATPYTRAQVDRFSPRSKAILEIQSARDLEILEKIYKNSVLLGDEGPDGWGIKYSTEFHMTNDSKLFPPRTKWEEQGYRPDEYSRWLKGDWRPIEELWKDLGVDPTRPKPVDIELEDWLFDTQATPAARAARSQLLHGHTLRPGDVQRTPWKLRCAQPPYDTLPIPRADIPPEIILSRNADAWIREERIAEMPVTVKGEDGEEREGMSRAIALPLYEGRMIGQFDFSQKGWVRGRGRAAEWREISWHRKEVEPQFLMHSAVFRTSLQGKNFNDGPSVASSTPAVEPLTKEPDGDWNLSELSSTLCRAVFMDVTSATNTRTVIAAYVPPFPCGNKVPVLNSRRNIELVGTLSSFAVDFVARRRMTGLSLNYFILAEFGLPLKSSSRSSTVRLSLNLGACDRLYSIPWLICWDQAVSRAPCFRASWAISESERVRLRCSLDAIVLSLVGLDRADVTYMLAPSLAESDPLVGDPKGFWRVDKDKDPELRHTVLTLVAFHDLEQKIAACGGYRDQGIAAFLAQNEGEGWLLPETLRLADYGLGHDDRANHPQPIRSRLGPRFYDWQLAQSPEESWRECHLHARNLLGESAYRQIVDDIERVRQPSLPGHRVGQQ